MAGNAYISHQHKIIVLWTPKCACTAVVEWFAELEMLRFKDGRSFLHENGYTYNYRQVRRIQSDLGYQVIQFTRNPYNRAVSAFINKFIIRGSQPLITFEKLEWFAKQLITAFYKQNDRDISNYEGLSFIEYLTFVQKLMSENAVVNPHWDAQIPRDVDFLVKPDFIIRQEDFDSDLARVSEKLKIPTIVPARHNATIWPAEFKEIESDEAGTVSLRLIEKNAFVSKSNFLNDTAISLINEIYDKDFKHFEYTKL